MHRKNAGIVILRFFSTDGGRNLSAVFYFFAEKYIIGKMYKELLFDMVKI